MSFGYPKDIYYFVLIKNKIKNFYHKRYPKIGSIEDWCQLFVEYVIEMKLNSYERFKLKKLEELFYDFVEFYDDEMMNLSDEYSFAPGKLNIQDLDSFTFFYKGAEVIYYFPWERTNGIIFFDTKYGYKFNQFYDYVKYRYVMEDFRK